MGRSRNIEPTYLDLPRLAEYSSLSVSTLRDHIRHGGLSHYRVRGKILVRRDEFDRWLSQFKCDHSVNLDELVDEVVKSIIPAK